MRRQRYLEAVITSYSLSRKQKKHNALVSTSSTRESGERNDQKGARLMGKKNKVDKELCAGFGKRNEAGTNNR
jgi:hypothetical protein